MTEQKPPIVMALGAGPWTIECSQCGPVGVLGVPEHHEGDEPPYAPICMAHLEERHKIIGKPAASGEIDIPKEPDR